MDELRGHLVDVCKDARARSGTSKTRIAAAINKGEQSVSRFEQGVGGWHGQTGELVDAYARLAGVDPADLWTEAISRWKASQQLSDQSPQGKETKLDTAELSGKLNKRLGSGQSRPQQAPGPSQSDPPQENDPPRPRRRQRASGNA